VDPVASKESEDERDERAAELEALEKALEEQKGKSQEYLTKLKYLQADFENYRKRVDKELMDAGDASATRLVTQLLPVLDSLELAAEGAKDAGNAEVAEGVKMVYRNLLATLEGEGLKHVGAVGKPFNPKLHEAVEKVQGSGNEDRVIEEVRKGFVFRGQVIRPSMVKVELAGPREGGAE
jgi:molecular chaperone GrpE